MFPDGLNIAFGEGVCVCVCVCQWFKGLVHPKLKIVSLFTCAHILNTF